MNYRTDPKTGDRLSILGFGCMRFPRRGGRTDMAKSEAMVLEAVSRGVNYFDTAYVYPGSEEALGHIVAKNGLRSKIYIATKLPLFMVKTASDFDKFFNKSLERLKTDYIDYYLMHMITTPEQWKSLCGIGIEKWIDGKKASGQIKRLGFSFHGKREDFVDIVDACDWDFTMIQYNYLDINNQAGRTGLKHAAGKGMPVMIMEPLLGGRLADIKEIPERARAALKAGGRRDDGQRSNSADTALTPAARALRWVWDHEEVTLLLSGMSTREQLDENINTAEFMTSPNILSDGEKKIIDDAIAAFNESNKIGCTGCGYCIPCPFGVNIPGCFSCYNRSYVTGRLAALKYYVMTTAALASKRGLASSCAGCGKCEEHCPQSIPIRQSLKTVSRRLEPFWFRAGISAARFMTSVKAGK